MVLNLWCVREPVDEGFDPLEIYGKFSHHIPKLGFLLRNL
jgi:hypothetical protein